MTTIRSGYNELFSSKDAHGKLSLKAESGKYSLCFTSQVSKPQVRSFDVRVRSELDWEDLDNDKAATKKQTDKVEDLVRRLLDRVLDVQDRRYQHHAITHEQVYRSTAESTHDRVIWWTVVESVGLPITSLSQVWYLKSFFETKQIIEFLFCFLIYFTRVKFVLKRDGEGGRLSTRYHLDLILQLQEGPTAFIEFTVCRDDSVVERAKFKEDKHRLGKEAHATPRRPSYPGRDEAHDSEADGSFAGEVEAVRFRN